jgi:glycosyltransferase involved in cell wall biosynthesis
MNGLAPSSATWLSVVMPVHNGAQWIAAALQSIAAEKADGIEVLLLDSSVDDASRTLAATFSDRLHLRIFPRPDLKSWQAKTNLGVSLASAPHICTLHQDDLWLPGRAAALRDWIATAGEAPLHLAPSLIVDEAGRTLGLWRCPLPNGGPIAPAFAAKRLLVQNYISIPAPLFRKEAWLACGGMDEHLWYTADWDLWLRLVASSSVYYHDKPTTAFRIHRNSLTVKGSRDTAEFAKQLQIVFDRHLSLAECAPDVERAGRISIQVNTALADAGGGHYARLAPALIAILRLGPLGVIRFLRDSRLVERLLPRLRAKFAGAL